MNKSGSTESGNPFLIDCDAGQVGCFRANAESVWIKVGQRVRRHETHELWESVAVEGKAQPDGSLLVRVLIFNPDWDEPLQIASIQSRPDDSDCFNVLACNLNHVAI
jgi:hypothetical protein